MIPTERTQLSWILKNSEKQENRENGFYLYFFVFHCFSKKNYLRRSPRPCKAIAPSAQLPCRGWGRGGNTLADVCKNS
jgi:hypothetical protein